METGLIPRQLDLEFDYEGYEITGAARKVLESCAKTIYDIEDKAREYATDKAMKMAAKVREARSQFAKQDDQTWESWVKERLGKSVSWANKWMKVDKVLGKKDQSVLVGVPVSRLCKLCQDNVMARDRNKVLRAAVDHYLTERDVDGMLGESNGHVGFTASVPSNHDELVAHLGKKCTNLKKRLDEELKGDLGSALRELATMADDGEI